MNDALRPHDPDNEAPQPLDPAAGEHLQQVAQVIADPRTGSWALSGLLLLAILTALHLARAVVLPIVVALVLSLVFLPAVRFMKKVWIPAPLGAAVVVLGLLAAFLGGSYKLAEPAGVWLDKAPQMLREIDAKMRRVTGSVKEVASATAQVQDLTQKIAGGSEKKVQQVEVKGATLASTVVDATREFAVTAMRTLVLLYFLLACGDMFLRKTITATPRLVDKKRAVSIVRHIESAVSGYLFMVTLINIALGSAVTLAMMLLDVPNPVLWGVMVGVFNFVPYLGDIASFSILSLVGLLCFDEIWRSLLVPGAFCLLTAAEGYLITPLIIGRRQRLNPVVIVLSVLFWGWMWGVLGALLAVPILIALKTLCDRVETLRVFADFLGD